MTLREGPDPVHDDEEGWWFWDETWTYRYGPFESYEEAESACEEYAEGLG